MGDNVKPTIDGKVLSELKVVELKKELGKVGLSKLGNKRVLYNRLKKHLLGVATLSDLTEQESLVKLQVDGEGDRNKSMSGEQGEDVHGDFEKAERKDPGSEIEHQNNEYYGLEEEYDSEQEKGNLEEVKAEKFERPTPVKKEYAAERKTKRERSISPARYPVNQVLMIRQLRRPFTAKQLMELLKTFGTVMDNEFWMDSIKSMCLVKFSTVEEATVARGGLHNFVWPSLSPTALKVDYSDDEGLLRHMCCGEKPKTNAGAGSLPAGATSLRASVSLLNHEQRLVQGLSTTKSQGLATNKDKEREHARGVERARFRTPPNRESEAKSSEKRRREEWHDHSKRGHSPIARRVQEPEKTVKTPDDFFKKTTTLPAIYYVALTEDQIWERSKRKAVEAQMFATRRMALQNSRRGKGERGDMDKPNTSTKKAGDGPSTKRSRSPRNAKGSQDTRNMQRGRSSQTESSRYNRR